MNEAKYISVIHEDTQKLVTAFKFEHDATWIGKEKENLLATHNYCEPGQKIKMCFVKSFPRTNGKFVHAYFRAMPGEPNPKNEISGESPEHRRAKENVYAGLYSGEIKVDGEPIDLELVKDILIEHRTSARGYVIPDVKILFKDIHPKFGLGIFFEIQLSKQKEEETIERTYLRDIEGLSGVWLGYDDFGTDWKFNRNNIEIPSHKKLLLQLEDIRENDFIKRLNKYGEAIDKKINDYEKDVNNISVESIENVKDDFNSYKKEIQLVARDEISKIELENLQLKELKEVASNLNLDELKRKADDINFNLSEKGKKWLNDLSEKINKQRLELTSVYKKINDWKLGEVGIEKHSGLLEEKCPICGLDMKIGKAMSGYNWYCEKFPRCDGFLKGVGEYENKNS